MKVLFQLLGQIIIICILLILVYIGFIFSVMMAGSGRTESIIMGIGVMGVTFLIVFAIGKTTLRN